MHRFIKFMRDRLSISRNHTIKKKKLQYTCIGKRNTKDKKRFARTEKEEIDAKATERTDRTPTEKQIVR